MFGEPVQFPSLSFIVGEPVALRITRYKYAEVTDVPGLVSRYSCTGCISNSINTCLWPYTVPPAFAATATLSIPPKPVKPLPPVVVVFIDFPPLAVSKVLKSPVLAPMSPSYVGVIVICAIIIVL